MEIMRDFNSPLSKFSNGLLHQEGTAVHVILGVNSKKRPSGGAVLITLRQSLSSCPPSGAEISMNEEFKFILPVS